MCPQADKPGLESDAEDICNMYHGDKLHQTLLEWGNDSSFLTFPAPLGKAPPGKSSL